MPMSSIDPSGRLGAIRRPHSGRPERGLPGDVRDVPEVSNLCDAVVTPVDPDEVGGKAARRRTERRDRRHAVDPAGLQAQILARGDLAVTREVLTRGRTVPLVARHDVEPGLLAEERAQAV